MGLPLAGRPRPRPHLVLALVVLLAACGGGASGDGADTPARVVATTSIVADAVGGLLGGEVDVTALMPPGVDPHAYAPAPTDVAAVEAADVVVAVGAGLEAGLEDVLANAEAGGVTVLRLTDHVDLLPFAGDHEEDHDGTALDPHVWFDPDRMATALAAIASDLDEALGGAVDVAATADAYLGGLVVLGRDLDALVRPLPAERRVLVTNHDNLGYLADRFGFEVVGTVLPGGTTQTEADARRLADLADLVRTRGVPAVFVDVGDSARLAEALAAEVGDEVAVIELHTDALGPAGSGADTYVGLLRTDLERIVAALGA